MQIIDFIICDDIRFEEGNKRSFMGVAEDTFYIIENEKSDKWPKQMSFGLAIKGLLSPEEVGKNPKSFGLSLKIADDEKLLGKSPLPEDSVAPPQNKKISVAVVMKNYPVKKPGKLSVILTIYDENDNVMLSEETPGVIMVEAKAVEGAKKIPIP